jgi:uncharacterized membrane protein HdeD (DUF308 family)
MAQVHELAGKWSWYVLLGASLILLGTLAIVYAWWSTLVSVIFFGALLFIAGFFEAIQAFAQKKWNDSLWHILIGLLYAIVGILLIVNPVANAQGLTLLMAAFFIVAGIFKTVLSFALRLPNWGWSVLGGILTALLGILILKQWPLSGLWIIGLFVGIDLIFSGWTWVILGLALKQVHKEDAQ